jgi:hypothetical protein
MTTFGVIQYAVCVEVANVFTLVSFNQSHVSVKCAKWIFIGRGSF